MSIVIVVSLITSSRLPAQQALRPSASAAWAALAPPPSHLPPLSVPDSVRRKTGYQHWKGGAVGGGLGALGGLVLALAAPNSCADCASNSRPVGEATLIGAGAP